MTSRSAKMAKEAACKKALPFTGARLKYRDLVTTLETSHQVSTLRAIQGKACLQATPGGGFMVGEQSTRFLEHE